MKNIIKDFKILGITLLFSLLYFTIIRERFDIFKILYMIDRLIIYSFSVNLIIYTIIIYYINLKYINNLYKYLSINFIAVGINSLAYICFLNQASLDTKFYNSCLSIGIFSHIFECAFMIYSFYKSNKKINYKKFLIGIVLLTIGVVYACSLLSMLPVETLKTNKISFFIMQLNLLSIILYICLLRLIKKKKEYMTESMSIYLKKYIYIKVISIISSVILFIYSSYYINIIHYILRILSNYYIIKIIVIEMIKKPNEDMYKRLSKKSYELEETVAELKKTIKDKDMLYDDFEKKTKQEEIKNEILANISHEFKTPVNVIYSAVQTQDLIKEKASIDEIVKYNKIIKQNCNRLTRLINNFIDTSRFNKDTVKGEFVCKNIVEITEYLTMAVVPFAKSKRLNLIFDTSDEEMYCLIDKELYDRLILNLLSNSIKYSRTNGNIKVELSDLGEYIQILVEDDGIGIDKYHLKEIFSRFERVDKSYSRNTEGCGLGLNIVKNIVSIHEGTIDVQSKKEEGTKVFIKLPKYEGDIDDNIEGCHRLEDNKYVKYEVEVEMSDIY